MDVPATSAPSKSDGPLLLSNARFLQAIKRPEAPARQKPSGGPPRRGGAPGKDFGGGSSFSPPDADVSAGPPSDLGGGKGNDRRKKEFGKDKKPAGQADAFRGKKKGRGGRFADEEPNLATMRTEQRTTKKRGAKRRGVYAPPPPPTGPAVVRLGEAITVGELAQQLGVGAAEVIKDLMKMGVLASITQAIDAETATKIAEGFGAEVRAKGAGGADVAETALGVVDDEDDPTQLMPRPPVVTIMGHVDHGKTSLLDTIRAASVASGEAGGITQHIGAYQVTTEEGGAITFIDTPGHAAFSAMRQRGANATDIVILVVAADDGVKEQTISSIRAAKAADVPVIVAINKIDKEGAAPQNIKTQLLEHELVLEEFGGDVLSAEVSAKTKQGLPALLEQIAMQAEVLDLRANPARLASGLVLEARQVVGQGAVATVLVQKGTLRVGDIVVAGAQWGRVRSLLDDQARKLESVTPSMAVELVGLNGLPSAGDSLMATEDESKARSLAEVRQSLERERRSIKLFNARSTQDRELFLGGLKDGLPTKLIDLVVKADVQGSAEALTAALEELEDKDDMLQVRTRVLRAGAGAITSEDVMLASVSNAVVVGFNSAASRQTAEEAARQGVKIKEYAIIYDAIDDVRAMIAALVRPPPSKQLGQLVGTGDVLQIFKIGAVGKVAGCKILDGYIRVGCNIRILRGIIIVYEGKLQSLRSFKDLVDQVDAPAECGVSFDDYQGMEPEDRVEIYLPNAGGGDDVGFGGSGSGD